MNTRQREIWDTAHHPWVTRGRDALCERYLAVRHRTVALAAPLSVEDQSVQSMPDASPTKWHLGHTTWFFETVVLAVLVPGWRCVDERFAYLFNSYYESLGRRQPRPQRGMITRPGIEAVHRYRDTVDEHLIAFVTGCSSQMFAQAAALIEIGLAHEQQHQELILTDIKHALGIQPFDPIYRPREVADGGIPVVLDWIECPGGKVAIGHPPGEGFAFDNEGPCHTVWLAPYRLANRTVTCSEYAEFIADGGYERPEFWLSDGWTAVCEQNWRAPMYWREEAPGDWSLFTLHGRRTLEPHEPVCHVSLYEAAAYACWANARLPTEFEWEATVGAQEADGHFADSGYLHPRAVEPGQGLLHPFGNVWEWTRSSYDPYPGFMPMAGALAEYNGKFMIGQLVLRGGSCVTPAGHVRATYRNFFPPPARWQFSSFRLAKDAT